MERVVTEDPLPEGLEVRSFQNPRVRNEFHVTDNAAALVKRSPWDILSRHADLIPSNSPV